MEVRNHQTVIRNLQALPSQVIQAANRATVRSLHIVPNQATPTANRLTVQSLHTARNQVIQTANHPIVRSQAIPTVSLRTVRNLLIAEVQTQANRVALIREVRETLRANLPTTRSRVHPPDLLHRAITEIITNRNLRINRALMQILRNLLMLPAINTNRVLTAAEVQPGQNHLQNTVRPASLLRKNIRGVVQNQNLTVRLIEALLPREAVLQKSKTPIVKAVQLRNQVTRAQAVHREVHPHQKAIHRAGRVARREVTTVRAAAQNAPVREDRFPFFPEDCPVHF